MEPAPDLLPPSFLAAPRHPRIRRAVLLHQARGCWTIAAGAVDIFAVDMTGGAPPFPWRPLTRLEPGDGFSGLGFFWEEGRHPPLLAVPTPDACLCDAAADGLPEGWVARLMALGPRGLPPLGTRILHAPAEATLPAGMAVCAGQPLLWLESDQPVTLADGSVAGPSILPVTPDCWLDLPAGARVRVVATAGLADPATRAECLRQAVRRALDGIARGLTLAAGAEAATLARREGAAAGRVQAAARQMAGLLDHGPPPAPSGDAEDPLAAVCRRVALHAGIDLSRSVHGAPDGQEGDRIEALARANGVRVRRARLPDGWWRSDLGPCVGVTAAGQPVALLPGRFGYRMVDPAGVERRVDGRTAAEIGPVVHTFSRAFPEGRLTRRRMMAFAAAHNIGGLILILAASLCASGLALLTPLVTGHIFDLIIPRAETEALKQVIVVLVAAACAGLGFGVARSLTELRLRGQVDAVVQSAVWDRLLRLPAAFFRRYEAGDLVARAAGINALSSQLTGATLSALLGGLFSFASFGLMLYYQPVLALVGLVCVLVVVAGGVLFALAQLMTQREQYALRGQLSARLFQIITGIQTLRVNNAERLAFWDWSRLFVRDLRFQLRASVLSYSQSLFSSGLMLFFQVVAFALFAFYTNGVSTGTFIAFNSAFGQFFGGLAGFAGAIVSLFSLAPLYERTEPILTAEPETGHGRIDPGALSGRIRLQSVQFTYEGGDRAVLDDVSVDIRPGEFIAIVGPSGSGKSTLIRLLLGFVTPTRGAVSYDDHDLARLDLSAVRRQLGVVLQSGTLLPGTILDNIVANGAYSLEEAWQAARDAGLEDDLRAMPMGLHTPVGEGGATFSGGQRQRLLIARAIIRRPRIILFDEATSALDNITQARVSAALAQMRTTRILIAHRLSTIVQADRILVLDGGRIVESGSYADLMARGGAFAALAGRQLA